MNLKKKILQFCTKDMELYNFIHNMKENRKKNRIRKLMFIRRNKL